MNVRFSCNVVSSGVEEGGGGVGAGSPMKEARMLVVSLRGVKFRFWSCLGCSGQNTILFSRKGLLELHSKKY